MKTLIILPPEAFCDAQNASNSFFAGPGLRWGAYDAPPDPYFEAHLRRLDLGAFGASSLV